MNTRRLVPAGEASIEIHVVNSRFIAFAAPAETVEEARAVIGKIRAYHPEANHHVPALIIGHGQSIIEHCQDDGEPAGTAGRPCLAVLKGSGLGNIVVVVVRYFGGTKLGTGGLVRAYTDAVKAVLDRLEIAELIPTQTLMLAFLYTYFDNITRLVSSYRGQILDEDFGADVTLTIRFPSDQAVAYSREVRELTRGTVLVEVIATDQNTAFPVHPSSPGPEQKSRRPV